MTLRSGPQVIDLTPGKAKWELLRPHSNISRDEYLSREQQEWLTRVGRSQAKDKIGTTWMLKSGHNIAAFYTLGIGRIVSTSEAISVGHSWRVLIVRNLVISMNTGQVNEYGRDVLRHMMLTALRAMQMRSGMYLTDANSIVGIYYKATTARITRLLDEVGMLPLSAGFSYVDTTHRFLHRKTLEAALLEAGVRNKGILSD